MSIGSLILLLRVVLNLPIGPQFVISGIEGPRPSETKFDAFINCIQHYSVQCRGGDLVLKKSEERGRPPELR